jgi:transposase-like protein
MHSDCRAARCAMLIAWRCAIDERISSAEAARLLGIKTQTLAKWRWQGRGPRGWV